LGFALWGDADKKNALVTSNHPAAGHRVGPRRCWSSCTSRISTASRSATASRSWRRSPSATARGRVYPSQSRRLAPDFGFHPQVYRADGETVLLQPGKYKVSYVRGPEYPRPGERDHGAGVPPPTPRLSAGALDPPSGEGLVLGRPPHPRGRLLALREPDRRRHAEDMMRHVLGEDLNVGCCLSWGPCWYHQEALLHPARWTRSRRPTTCCATTSRCRASRRARAATSACYGCVSRTTRAPSSSTTGRAGTCRSSSGPRGRAAWSASPTAAGGAWPPCARRTRVSAICPTTCRRAWTASAPTSTWWTSPTGCATSSRRWTRRRCTS